jgi:hypothetical protein
MSARQDHYNRSEKGRAARKRYAQTLRGRAVARWAKDRYRRRKHGAVTVVSGYTRADGTVVRGFTRRIRRSRRAYDAHRYAMRAESLNIARRASYAILHSAAARRRWRVEREKTVAAQLQADRDGQLRFAGTIPELVALIAEQERDARTFQIKRSVLFVPVEHADRLFYGGVYRDDE